MASDEWLMLEREIAEVSAELKASTVESKSTNADVRLLSPEPAVVQQVYSGRGADIVMQSRGRADGVVK